MKTIKIFACPSHAAKERVSGVDFARIIQPMEYLNGWSDGKIKFKVTIYDPRLNESMDWLKVTAENDILFLNYTSNPWAFAIMGCLARKNKRKIVIDLDDNLWSVLPDNTAYHVFQKGGDGVKTITSICNEVDYVTCTSNYLKNAIVHNTNKGHDRIAVFPNYIDLGLYRHRKKFKDTLEIQLLHFGSSSHYKSLQEGEFLEGIDKIFKEYPNVVFKTVGAMIPEYRMKWGQRYLQGFGDTDVYAWIKNKFPKFMDESDIMVVPLTDNMYNRCKSSIKFLEASSAKIPGVWQDIRQYQEVVKNGENGFLAWSASQWHESIKKLIDDRELRKNMGESALKTVKKDWQMKDHVADYASFFKEVLDSS